MHFMKECSWPQRGHKNGSLGGFLVALGLLFGGLGWLLAALGGSWGGLGSLFGALGGILAAGGADPKAILAIPGGLGGAGVAAGKRCQRGGDSTGFALPPPRAVYT